MVKLQFATFSSDIELHFYASLASHKINHDKLDDSARRVLGVYELRPGLDPNASCRMQLHGNALTVDEVSADFYRAEGMIKNVNTIEDYRNLDKQAVLNRAGRTIWEAITDGTIYSCPSLLASFSAIFFADLKKYKFTYHFAFPALHSVPSWKFEGQNSSSELGASDGADLAVHALTSDETTALVDAVQTWRYSVDARQYGFFLAKKCAPGNRHSIDEDDGRPDTPQTPRSPGPNINFTWVIGSLRQYEEGFFEGIDEHDQFICFADPSTFPRNPGWMLRNLLVLVQRRWKLEKAQVLCYRDSHSRRHEARSVILRIEVDRSGSEAPADSSLDPSSMPKVTGWERNSAGKVASKIANLGEHMDPQRLADQAVDLNLKLIKWRIAPKLDLDIIKNSKCLLLGAGTLGSYVSRNLLGWGVRKITFVDNGSVSFSNPVRQPLFDFKDCLAGGAKKAHRAAEALSEIYPGVDSSGHVMSVPMAGHPILEESRVKAEYEKLRELIESHDVIFLLMDTRESRWLPTVIGKALGKLVMNAALGFDTFVVMRHGVKNKDLPPDRELGCYFCNDVVAPADSLSDRTLDQQCTVTRPGIAAMASALLVEVMVSTLQHPDKSSAPTTISQDEEESENPLGLAPHQIRGFLSSFENKVITGKSYDCCSACSDKVTTAYREGGWEFVKKCLNEKGYVEELSGLAEVQRLAEKAAADIEWDESSDGDAGIDSEGELL